MENRDKNNATILLRLPEDLKSALQREALVNGRRITAEVNIRLRESLKLQQSAPTPTTTYTPATATAIQAETPTAAGHKGLSTSERALLDAFHAMPVEQQLALLSLLRVFA